MPVKELFISSLIILPYLNWKKNALSHVHIVASNIQCSVMNTNKIWIVIKNDKNSNCKVANKMKSLSVCLIAHDFLGADILITS